jgi:hypothetical protein
MKKKEADWTEEEIVAGMRNFKNRHGHFPTATEVDNYDKLILPAARTLQRRFGGIVGIKKKMGLTEEESDLRTGAHSSKRASKILARAHENENQVYMYLCELFGKPFVHREYFFTDDHRTRADFFVHDAHGGFCIDVFYPENIKNLNGCLNLKLDKYELAKAYLVYPVLFVQMNEKITDDEIKEMMGKKKRKLLTNFSVISLKSMKSFCAKRKPLKVKS